VLQAPTASALPTSAKVTNLRNMSFSPVSWLNERGTGQTAPFLARNSLGCSR